MVLTGRGEVPIENVTTTDHVLTRRGWRRVNWSGVTGERSRVWTVEFDNGATLTGTGSHPVWVDGRGWVPLESLAYGDRLAGWQPESKRSNSAVASTVDTPIPSTAIIGCTTSATTDGRPHRDCCTATSGNPFTGRFPMAATFTTMIATRIITTLLTWFALLWSSTGKGTRKLATIARKLCSLGSIAFDIFQWRGTARRPGEPFTVKMESVALQHAGQTRSKKLVLSAVSSTRQSNTNQNSVLPSAWPSTGVIPVLTTNPECASSASHSSRSTDSPKPSDAPSVIRIRPAGEARVYNLSVDECPEFYANGVLVHNCDVAAYAAQVALYDAIVRAGMAGLEEIAAQYAEPDPDDPGAIRRPWLLEAGETLEELPDPVVTVSLGGEEIDSHDPGTGDPVYLEPKNPALPPPESDTPEGDWPDVLNPPSPAAKPVARLLAPPGADPLSLE